MLVEAIHFKLVDPSSGVAGYRQDHGQFEQHRSRFPTDLSDEPLRERFQDGDREGKPIFCCDTHLLNSALCLFRPTSFRPHPLQSVELTARQRDWSTCRGIVRLNGTRALVARTKSNEASTVRVAASSQRDLQTLQATARRPSSIRNQLLTIGQ